MGLVREPTLNQSDMQQDTLCFSDPLNCLAPIEPPTKHTDLPIVCVQDSEPEPSEDCGDFYERESHRPMPSYHDIASDYIQPSARNHKLASI